MQDMAVRHTRTDPLQHRIPPRSATFDPTSPPSRLGARPCGVYTVGALTSRSASPLLLSIFCSLSILQCGLRLVACLSSPFYFRSLGPAPRPQPASRNVLVHCLPVFERQGLLLGYHPGIHFVAEERKRSSHPTTQAHRSPSWEPLRPCHSGHARQRASARDSSFDVTVCPLLCRFASQFHHRQHSTVAVSVSCSVTFAPFGPHGGYYNRNGLASACQDHCSPSPNGPTRQSGNRVRRLSSSAVDCGPQIGLSHYGVPDHSASLHPPAAKIQNPAPHPPRQPPSSPPQLFSTSTRPPCTPSAPPPDPSSRSPCPRLPSPPSRS